jgi:hypothetical protein
MAKKTGISINSLETRTAKKILFFLSKGYTQKDIPHKLAELDLEPNSIRSIELYIAEIKQMNGIKTSLELMYKYGKGSKIVFKKQKSK